MRITIDGTTHLEPSAAVAVSGEPDITVGWNMYSGNAGLGYSALGVEPGGFGGTFPQNIRYAYVKVTDTDTGRVVHRSEAIHPNDVEWTYPAAQNKLEHGGVFETDLTFTVVLVGPTGVESAGPPTVRTT